MKKICIHLCASLLLCLFGTAALAQVSAAQAEMLVRKSGLWTQLDAVPSHVQAGILESPMQALIPEAQKARMVQFAAQSFAPERMRKTLLATVQGAVQPGHLQQALDWYESPTGQRLGAMEDALSVPGLDVNATLDAGNQALAASTPQRQLLLAALLRAARSVDVMVDMGIHTAVAVFRGAVSVQPRRKADAVASFKAGLEQRRPAMVASTMGVALAMAALTYAPASDAELQTYVQFLSGEAAVATQDAMIQGLEQAFSQAAQDFGKQLVPKGKKPQL